ncbi:MAG: tetratricopeptide repeat protein [Desulfobacterales bacterium]|jgi:tetratricopeptide (TPR) repeat protein
MKSFFKKFSGKTPLSHENEGDELFAADLWGKAKIEYEHALQKLERTEAPDPDFKARLQKKIVSTKEALACGHKRSADDMLDAGFYDDARELYLLALELTEDPTLQSELKEKQKLLDFHVTKTIEESLPEDDMPHFEDDDLAFETEESEELQQGEGEDETFSALCGALPDNVQKAYLSYGSNFKKGYLALNRGEFSEAADYLSRALSENPASDSFIPLELATAYLNLDRHTQAQQLLETLLNEQPQALPAYQLLCEIFWEKNEFDRARALLDQVPEELTESVAVYLLKGECLFRGGKYAEAKTFYQTFLKQYGWDERVARALARTHEALNELANARNLYREMMVQCRSCHARIDPFIKERYADLCYDSGMLSSDILELYLTLAQEVPARAPEYFEKVSRIYAALGNEKEAVRFRAIAEKMARQ